MFSIDGIFLSSFVKFTIISQMVKIMFFRTAHSVLSIMETIFCQFEKITSNPSCFSKVYL